MKVQVRRVVVLAAAALALMLAACGSAEDDANTFDAGIDQANICEEIAEAMCYNIFECCTGLQREQVLGEELTLTEGECVDDMILRCEDIGAEQLHAVDNASIEFDMEAAKACVESLVLPSDSNCFAIELEPVQADLCFDISFFTGQVNEDDSCFWDWECAGSGYCQNDFTCMALPTEGDECANLALAPSQCAEGLFCEMDTDGNQLCAPFLAIGDECLPVDPCDPELYCEGWDSDDPTTTGTCENPLEIGENCTQDNHCSSFQCSTGFCESDAMDDCYDADDCFEGFCAGTTDLCSSDFECAQHCSTTTSTTCTTAVDCPVGETCEYDTCEKECIGRVCETEPVEIDYCEMALDAPHLIFD